MSSDGEQVKEGDVLAGKFVVERVLGEGGMGVVVAARHLHLDQRVALKFLRPSALAHRDMTERFAREARAATRLKNEHVARVLDVGAMENGAPYIVMEHLEGQDLAVLLRARTRLPANEAVDYVLQACEAIAEAHGAGIIHRDLKPGNLFVTTASDGLPLVKLLDFGISKVVRGVGGTKGSALTSTTELLGSPLYMSPEQLQSTRDVDVGTDIWSIGVILYEILAGAPPFTADSMPQLCMQIMVMPHIPLADVAPDVPEGLRAIVNRCLEKTPQKRYANVTDLAAALAAFTPEGARRSASIRRIARGRRESLPAVQGAFVDTVPSSMSWGQTLAKKPRRGIVYALAAAVLGVATGATVVGMRMPFGPRAHDGAGGVSAPMIVTPVDTLPAATPSAAATTTMGSPGAATDSASTLASASASASSPAPRFAAGAALAARLPNRVRTRPRRRPPFPRAAPRLLGAPLLPAPRARPATRFRRKNSRFRAGARARTPPFCGTPRQQRSLQNCSEHVVTALNSSCDWALVLVVHARTQDGWSAAVLQRLAHERSVSHWRSREHVSI